MRFVKTRIAIALVISAVGLGAAYAALQTFSYHPSESSSSLLFQDLNSAFVTHWKARTGVDISVRPAQNKSGKPIHAVLDGLNVATLALYYDPEKLREKKPIYCPGLEPGSTSAGIGHLPAGFAIYVDGCIPGSERES